MNIEFKELLIRSFSLDVLEFTWEITNSTLDPHNFHWYVERSESPEGPWDPIAGPFSDRYIFLDNRVNLLDRWRQLYYRLKSESKSDATNVVYSSAATQGAEPDLIAKEIQLLEQTVWREFTGRKCWVFPVRSFGQYCPNCMDVGKGGTFRKLRSNCLTCYDTQWAGGYLDPMEIYIQFDPNPKASQQQGTGELQQSNTTARLGNFPLLKPRDIIVEAENRRWRVVQVASTQRLRHVVHQEITLHEIVKGDTEFALKIDVGVLRELEPSPTRNFSNPQNLEAAEDEDFVGSLKAYGHNPS
ncbi:MAG: hypothetical protein KAY24_13680 [Candidatus Eisenbacteria sp.]|nr:hypothetical protein [Candidatus Eisenbacteria bacterium]